MDDRVAKLQPRVRALHRGQAGSQIRYPEDFRAEIIAVARAGRMQISPPDPIGV